jgi:formate-dependent nitrite reductase membrane component NrfD
MNLLSGYRTYIVAALGVVVTGLLAMGYIDQQTYNEVVAILGSLGLAFLRAGVKTATQ